LTTQYNDSNPKKEQYLQKQVARLREAVAKVHSEQEAAKTRDQVYKGEQLDLARKTVRFNRWTVGFTGLLALTALIAGGISFMQIVLLRHSNEINHEALEVVQGAVVSFSVDIEPLEIYALPTSKAADAWQFSIPFSNGGSTSTREGKVFWTYLCKKDAILDDFDFPDAPGEPGPFALGPKQSLHTNPVDIPIDCIATVYKHERHLYFYGWATYRDRFKSTPDRRTEFCYELTKIIQPTRIKGANTAVEFSLCKHHNCYDEECRK